MSDPLAILFRRIAQLEGMLVDMNRRMNNVMREGRVTDVDPETGLAIVDAQGGKSPPSPWLQRAGSIRDWDPPTPGERVILLSPGGDISRSMILPGGYSQQYGQPHNKLGEARRQIGAASDTFSGSQRVIEAQLIILRGTVQIEGPGLTHNGVNVGDTHKHTDVMTGGALTGLPT